MEKFLVLLADGFEEIEALTPVDFLRRGGVQVDTVSIKDNPEVEAAHGVRVLADKKFSEINGDDYLGLYIPGGMPGATNLRDSDRVIDMVRDFDQKEKLISAICAGPIVLKKAGVIRGRKFTSFPSFKGEVEDEGSYQDDQIVVRDGNLITGRGPAIALYEALEILSYLKGDEAKEGLIGETQQDKVEKFYGFKS